MLYLVTCRLHPVSFRTISSYWYTTSGCTPSTSLSSSFICPCAYSARRPSAKAPRVRQPLCRFQDVLTRHFSFCRWAGGTSQRTRWAASEYRCEFAFDYLCFFSRRGALAPSNSCHSMVVCARTNRINTRHSTTVRWQLPTMFSVRILRCTHRYT